jgi:hypothetical protein
MPTSTLGGVQFGETPRGVWLGGGLAGRGQLYPEWSLAAARGVGRELIVQVAAALMDINATHPAVLPCRFLLPLPLLPLPHSTLFHSAQTPLASDWLPP